MGVRRSWILMVCLLVGVAVIGSYSLAWGQGIITQLTPDGTDHWQAQWVDNQWVVCRDNTTDAIYRTDGITYTNISDPGNIYDCDSHPQVSNGMIAFQRNITGAWPGDGASLWVMDTWGGGQTQLVPFSATMGGAQWPMWNPDGTKIAFWHGGPAHTGSQDLWVIDYPGGTPMALTTGGQNPHNWMQWMRLKERRLKEDSVLTSFKHWIGGSQYRDVAKVTSTGTFTWLENITDTVCSMRPKASDRGWIFYKRDDNSNGDIWRMNRDGTNKMQLTDSASTGSPCYNNPEPHPNGEYVALWSDVNDTFTGTTDWRIWMMTTDGAYMGVVMGDPCAESNGSRANLEFSPNGNRLLFIGRESCASWTWQVYALDLDMGDPDGDGLKNYEEAIYNTDPSLADTDGGGESDFSEVKTGTFHRDPNDPTDDYVFGLITPPGPSRR